MPGKQKGGNKKAGRDKAKCLRYAQHKTLEKYKLKHMLKSNRFADVKAYALEHGLKVPEKPVKRKSAMQKIRELFNSVYVEE